MKRIFSALLLSIYFCTAHAQTIVANDSAETGINSSQMTFYSLGTGMKTVTTNTDWHLAVTVRATQFPESPLGGTTIRMNEAMGVKVYYVPNTNAAGFSTLDTTGFRTWAKLHDSDKSIDEGVLNSNRNPADYYDFGWGTYNAFSHNVVGDSLYLIQLPNGELKKFVVVNLVRDTAFNLKYSNLDNSDLQTIHIAKKDYLGKEFVYLNLTDNTVMDKEPHLADWDLQFLKYTATDVLQGQHISQVGVWLNKGVKAAKRPNHDVLDNDYSTLTFDTTLNAIGWDWKRPGSFLSLMIGKNIQEGFEFYIMEDSLAYFVKTKAGEYYKVVFTKYNINNGRINFYKEKLNATGIEETEAENKLRIFPNPANSVLNVELKSAPATINVVDISGRIISEIVATQNITQLNTSELATGVYLLLVTTNGKTSISKFVVSR